MRACVCETLRRDVAKTYNRTPFGITPINTHRNLSSHTCAHALDTGQWQGQRQGSTTVKCERTLQVLHYAPCAPFFPLYLLCFSSISSRLPPFLPPSSSPSLLTSPFSLCSLFPRPFLLFPSTSPYCYCPASRRPRPLSPESVCSLLASCTRLIKLS